MVRVAGRLGVLLEAIDHLALRGPPNAMSVDAKRPQARSRPGVSGDSRSARDNGGMTSTRIRRNRPKPLQVVPSLVLPAFPPPRDEWLAETIDDWEAFSGSEVASVIDLAADSPALYRLFDLYDERQRARRITWGDPVVEGSHGQLMIHPLTRRVAAINKELLALEDRFGMSPKARLALGIAIGERGGSLEALNAAFRSEAGE